MDTTNEVIVEEKSDSIQEESIGTTPISIEDITVPLTSNLVSISSLLTIDDILGTILIQKEASDRTIIQSIGNMTDEELREKLISWAKLGFPNNFELKRIGIVPPKKCTDGVTRNLTEYIQYCSGKSIQEHVDLLQSRVTGMTISCVDSFGCFCVRISKT
jgi:hypothetical protein